MFHFLQALRLRLRTELEAPPDRRRLGSGWVSGVGALVLAVACLLLVISLRHPGFLGLPELRVVHSHTWFRIALKIALSGSFLLAAINLVLRPKKTLGTWAMILTLSATLLGGSSARAEGGESAGIFVGLDWFVWNVIFTGFLFVPLERLFPHRIGQPLFRAEWREDLFYYLVSSMLVQVLTWLSFAPSRFILSHTGWSDFRTWVGAQPFWLQFLEIMFFTDLAQYWIHRAFHRVPWLWRFHAVHHSAPVMDWMASARMHFLEIVALRGVTALPMMVLGFKPAVVQAYILFVYVHSTVLHANLKWNLDRIGKFLATPRFHHWHHGLEKEAIDVNFAIHFPVLDKIFGTCHWPEKRWPEGYGLQGESMPQGYWKQFLYPFQRKKKS